MSSLQSEQVSSQVLSSSIDPDTSSTSAANAEARQYLRNYTDSGIRPHRR